MIETQKCQSLNPLMYEYVHQKLTSTECADFEAHLRDCLTCRDALKRFRAVQGILEQTIGPETLGSDFAQKTGQRLATIQPLDTQEEHALSGSSSSSWIDSFGERFGAVPWWGVSALLHVLVIALAGLVSMGIDQPQSEETPIMITELQARPEIIAEQEKSKTPSADVLESTHDTPPTDPTSKAASDIVVPPDILARAEVGDHYETINLDRPDTQSAFGNPDVHMFHSEKGNDEAEGGGGIGGVGIEELIGVGGMASAGTGGGWGGGNGTGTGIGNGSGHGSFGNRNGGGRRLMVMRHGGSKATESTVDLALQWLAYHQEPDGSWNAKKYGAKATADTAMTGLAVLAFLGAGHTEKVGLYKDNVQRGIAWLISKQNVDGSILDLRDQVMHARSYSVPIATLAMAEAAGMGNVKGTRAAAQKAIEYCTEIFQQGEGSDKGAWRYEPKAPVADLSVSGWFVMALKSAKVAGLAVNQASFDGAMKFLDSVEAKHTNTDKGYGPASTYLYTHSHVTHRHRTSAIGLLCRQFLGARKEDLQSSVELMVNIGGVPSTGNDAKGKSNVDPYYWYYGTLCVFQQGGDLWKQWNGSMKKVLPETQCKQGDDSGSWIPEGDCAEHWGRVGQTALNALCLEVYYRYMQLAPDK